MAHRLSLLTFATALAAACAASSPALAEETRTVATPPPEAPAHPDGMLVLSGALVFGVPYAVSVASAAASNVSSDQWLYAPVVGPWADLAARASCKTSGCRGDFGSIALPLGLDGLAQAGGVAMVIVALARGGEAAQQPPATAAAVHVAPASYPGGGGIEAFGRF